MNKILLKISLSLLLLSTAYSQPSKTDYVLGYGGLAAFFVIQFPLQESLAPAQPRWTEPDNFDVYFRDNLKWGNADLKTAASYSDILLHAVFLPGIFWTPLLSEHKYSDHLLLNIQVAAAAGLVTNFTKYIAGRQRPYSFFGTLESKGLDDYLSFFSGHTSLTFAVATSTAMIFEKENPGISGMLWSSLLGAAGLTGYLRIAADKHYMTDVITGALAGTLTAYLITKNQQRHFFKNKKSSAEIIQFSFVIPF